ncbi:MAG: molecular chaperone DnaJ [Cyanobacteria bacterium SW_9_44_58]|nr:MAG: molecular chaperone DnaJ [Cyanobacteria bacterium SW_9_44_58]
MPENQDYYEILRVSENATQEEIKKSFRRLARDCHPDLHPNDARAAERFRILREAYEVLSNTEQRKKYDRRRQKRSSRNQKQNTSQVYYVRGAEKLLIKDYRGAINALTEAIRLNGRFIEAYLKRCEAYLAVGKDRALLEDCQRILRYQPDNAIAYYYRGRARQRLGYTDSAVKAYNKAIRLQTNFAPPYYYRGIAYYELRYRNQAIYDWQVYVELCQQQGDMQGYSLGMDLLRRCSWLYIKPGNQALRWWHWGKAKVATHFDNPRSSPFQALTSLKHQMSQLVTRLGFIIQTWLGTLLQVMRDPVGGMLPAYGRFEPLILAMVSVGFMGVAQAGLMLSMSFLGWSGDAIWRLFPVGMIPIFSLFLASLITRAFLMHHRHWTGDLFFASSAVLPIGIFLLFAPLMNLLPNFLNLLFLIIGSVFALSHTILLLYGGCTQLLNVSESQAAFIVPIMIVLTAFLTGIVSNQFL